MLYAFFEVTGPSSVEFFEFDNSLARHFNEQASGMVSAAFFNDTFHLAFKKPNRQPFNDPIHYGWQQEYPAGWSEELIATGDVVDGPSFAYDIDTEANTARELIWTEAQ